LNLAAPIFSIKELLYDYNLRLVINYDQLRACQGRQAGERR